MKVTVSHSYGESFSTKSFSVTTPEEAGKVTRPSMQGLPQTAQVGGFGQPWRVVGPGELLRVTHEPVIFFPTTSQFYNKIYQHELVHRNQWLSGGIGENYYLATGPATSFYEWIKNETAPTKLSLETSIEFEKALWRLEENIRLEQNLGNGLEEQAYAVSDQIAPLYLYQGACGGAF